MKLYLLPFLLVLLMFSNLSCSQNSTEDFQNSSEDLKIIHDKFEYKNKPIDPKLLQEFLPWLSDGGSIVTSVNIAVAYGTDEYSDYNGKITENNGAVRFTYDSGNYTEYVWLGTLDNDIHLLTITQGGGGTGRFNDLMLVNFDINPKKQDRNLNMNIVGLYPLGDRMKYEITTYKNKIFVENELYKNNKLVLKCKKDYCFEVKK